MAHLNLTLLHPFSDGNGRTARCLQTAVLANEGMAAQEFSSIEEYRQDPAGILRGPCGAGAGGFILTATPSRGYVSVLRATIGSFRRSFAVTRSFRIVYTDLFDLLVARGLHERMALALLEAGFGRRVRNASYRISAGISNNLASRDLKQLVDQGLLEAHGEKRGRHYLAGPEVREIREKRRLRKEIDDPFGEPQADANQLALAV